MEFHTEENSHVPAELDSLQNDISAISNRSEIQEISSFSHSSFPGANGISPPKGRCVREFEEEMANLKKENFNLKLKIYFLEEKLTPEQRENRHEEENFFKENIHLKEEVEKLRKDIQERQKLLGEASKAIQLLEEQQKIQFDTLQSTIDALNEKVELLTTELENERLRKEKSFYANDTGFTEFCGTVEQKENQKIIELDAQNTKLLDQLTGMELTLRKLANEKEAFSKEVSSLKNEGLKNKKLIMDMENQLKDNQHIQRANQENLESLHQEINSLTDLNKNLTSKLDCLEEFYFFDQESSRKSSEEEKENLGQIKEELYQLKVKHADTVCELDDAETKLKEKTDEHYKALEIIEKLSLKIRELYSKIEDEKADSAPQSLEKNDNFSNPSKSMILNLRQQFEKITTEKDQEIEKLREELRKRTQNLQGLVNKELWEKNREIERLSQIINNLQTQQRQQRSIDNSYFLDNNSSSLTHGFSSFNETRFNEMMEMNQKAQLKINSLVQKLCNSQRQVSKSDVDQLQAELKDLNEKHEACENVRKGVVELCGVLTDRLEELTGFLSSLLDQADIVALLGEEKGKSLRKALDRSLDLSRSLNISRLSLPGDQSLVHLGNLTSLGLLDCSILSNIDFSENISLVANLKTEVESLKSQLAEKNASKSSRKKSSESSKKVELLSDSEEWSEPDRNVSMARIGLEKNSMSAAESRSSQGTTEDEKDHNQKEDNRKVEVVELQERLRDKDDLLAEKNNVMIKIQEKLLQIERESKENLEKLNEKLILTTEELDTYRRYNENLKCDIDECSAKLEVLQSELMERTDENYQLKEDKELLNQEMKEMSEKYQYMEQEIQEMCAQFTAKNELVRKLQDELEMLEQELENSVSKLEYDQLNGQIKRQQERMTLDQEQIIFMQTEITKMQKAMKDYESNTKIVQDNLKKIARERDENLGEKLELRDKLIHLQEELDNIKFERNELEIKLFEFEGCGKFQKMTITDVDGASGYGSEDVPHAKEELASGYSGENTYDEEDKENIQSRLEKPLLKTLEISEDRKTKLLSNNTFEDSKNSQIEIDPECDFCLKSQTEIQRLQTRMVKLETLVKKACYKLSQQDQRKKEVEKNIKKEILKTKEMLENVRSNMENGLDFIKERNGVLNVQATVENSLNVVQTSKENFMKMEKK